MPVASGSRFLAYLPQFQFYPIAFPKSSSCLTAKNWKNNRAIEAPCGGSSAIDWQGHDDWRRRIAVLGVALVEHEPDAVWTLVCEKELCTFPLRRQRMASYLDVLVKKKTKKTTTKKEHPTASTPVWMTSNLLPEKPAMTPRLCNFCWSYRTWIP